MAAIIGSDKELARIFRIGMVDPGALNEDEFTQFGYLGISLFRRFENVFFQYQSGMIDEDFGVSHRGNIFWFFHRTGIQAWWKDRKFALTSVLESSWIVPLAARSRRRKRVTYEPG